MIIGEKRQFLFFFHQQYFNLYSNANNNNSNTLGRQMPLQRWEKKKKAKTRSKKREKKRHKEEDEGYDSEEEDDDYENERGANESRFFGCDYLQSNSDFLIFFAQDSCCFAVAVDNRSLDFVPFFFPPLQQSSYVYQQIKQIYWNTINKLSKKDLT